MGNLCLTKLTCCKDEDESDWYFSQESLPKDIDIECQLDWSKTPQNSPLTQKEIAELYKKEYLYQNRYKKTNSVC